MATREAIFAILKMRTWLEPGRGHRKMTEKRAARSNLRRHISALSACLLLAACAAFAQVDAPVRPPAASTQGPQKTGFRAVSYEVFASLVPENQMLMARAIVEFEAQTP